MGLIISDSDFIGFYAISQNCFSKPEIIAYITQFEQGYIDDLLGCELAVLFIADLDGNGAPQNQIYKDIYNALCFKDSCKQWTSKGMKDMMLGLMYYDIARDQPYQNTINGSVMPSSAASEIPPVEGFANDVEERYNRAIKSYKAIQAYIKFNITDYPTYFGQSKDHSFFGGAI